VEHSDQENACEEKNERRKKRQPQRRATEPRREGTNPNRSVSLSSLSLSSSSTCADDEPTLTPSTRKPGAWGQCRLSFSSSSSSCPSALFLFLLPDAWGSAPAFAESSILSSPSEGRAAAGPCEVRHDHPSAALFGSTGARQGGGREISAACRESEFWQADLGSLPKIGIPGRLPGPRRRPSADCR